MKPLELYIHIPFCARKCAYCDFLSGTASELFMQGYVGQLVRELAYQSAFYQEYEVVTVFLGGGTPSILKAGEIWRLLEAVNQFYPV